jgi:hypothetical protein
MMRVRVEIIAAAPAPPEGAPVIVQIRDTAMQDVSSTIMAETLGTVEQVSDTEPFAIAEVDCPQQGAMPTVWVHVDVDRDGRVSKGDYITTQSYPVSSSTVRVEVKKVI